MKTEQASVIAEVQWCLEQCLARGEPVRAEWLAQQVLARHPNHEGEDAGWYTRRAYEALRAAVRIVTQRYAPKSAMSDEDRALVLPGFKHLQTAYLVNRGGTQHVVPLGQMTTGELEGKEQELRRMGAGCFEHADELARRRETLDAGFAA